MMFVNTKVRDNVVLGALAVGYLLLQILPNLTGGYGYFRDELYYIACAKRLAFGYVDHPPLAPFLLRVVLETLGNSIVAIRLLPAIAGAGTVLLIGLMARRLGGKIWAQCLAGFAIATAPVFLVMGGFFSMNPFETLLWTGCGYVMLLLIQQDAPKLWLLVGVLVGLGLLNKHTLIVYVGALALGVLLTPVRKFFTNKWLWIGAFLAIMLIVPNMLWQIRHEFTSLEFYRNATAFKNIDSSPLNIVLDQLLAMNPVTAPIWLAGLYFYLFSRQGKPYRFFGWMYVILFSLLIIARSSRPDRILAAYPVLFAGGAVMLEEVIVQKNRHMLSKAIVIVVILGGIGLLPLGLPILPPAMLVRYSRMLGFSVEIEQGETPQLPQWFADRFGWEDLVAAIARVYQTLLPEEQAKCAIFVNNYGEAGAIDFFGPQYTLPNAISNHNNYWLWGPGDDHAELVITLGGNLQELQQIFREVKQVGLFQCEYCMPYENNQPIYLCRGLQIPLKELWPKIKNYS